MDMITVTAKTVDEAVTKALIELETTSDKLEYEVVDKGSAGFLGIGAKPAIIRAKKKDKGEDSHHQFCLQPFPNVVVYAEIDIPALVVQLPHGEAGYVAAEMLQDNLHSVRVALCRYHNDRIGNKGIFRVAGFVTIRPIHQHFPPDIFLISQKSLSACTVSCFSTY